ncbi:MAG: hypothetical protein A3F47_02365 [Candidatus Staskawiczbacteria bacterium RIFCSPHIGHO2_12_FULL_38_11]|uniref:Glycosyltransferase 2-like domain-containing protein n=1 Tax=Candidatus Staskawiczbacteria bacterium RIFCSPHIGHO2_12_FULL_38_11 TaxID=1802209 RepID=A0A1G2I579_9BACT|nr:MAG: hypothetical protein A3F47_02365 [Candidatus Staskawiczbacteria bacterium RIFCSPHIGHO2_12_FULL_38_11]
MISIIIPALNEEDYLALLLESIQKQDFNDYEIILADAGSTDKTKDIAQKYNCSIIQGGLPAKGRNNGAKAARGDILFFLDADTVLPDGFFQKSLEEFKKRNLDLGSFCLVPLPKSKVSYFFMNIFYNQPIVLLESALVHAAVGIMVKREIFDKTGGFDEDIKLAEDHYFARRARIVANAKCGIFKSTEIFVSDRRFRRDGWATIGIKYLLCEMHLIFIGPVKSDIFNYRFNHYKDEKIESRK